MIMILLMLFGFSSEINAKGRGFSAPVSRVSPSFKTFKSPSISVKPNVKTVPSPKITPPPQASGPRAADINKSQSSKITSPTQKSVSHSPSVSHPTPPASFSFNPMNFLMGYFVGWHLWGNHQKDKEEPSEENKEKDEIR